MLEKIKKQVIFVLVLALMCGICNISVYAESITQSGDVASCFTVGDGTEENPYKICNGSEYAYFLSNLNSGITYEGAYFELGEDIDVSAVTLSKPTGVFNGIFNGKGYTITSAVPFMYAIGRNGTVKLLIYRATSTVAGELLCAENYGTVESCSVYGNANTGSKNTALLCCKNGGSIINTSIVGSIIGEGNGYSLYLSEAVYENNGTMENVYCSVKITGSASGRYSSFNSKAFVYTNNGTVKNCYFNSAENNLTTSIAAAMTGEEMKSSDFVEKLNSNNTTLTADWIEDTAGVNGGYPIICADEKIEETVSMSYNPNEAFTYHTESIMTEFILSSDRACTIYYTTDGTNPQTSSTRKEYSGSSIAINGDTTVKSVAYYKGIYGRVSTQTAVSVLGAGTEENPYEVADKNDLKSIYLEPSAYYKMTNDIVFEDSDYGAGGILPSGWISIPRFSGSFNGDGHKIENLQGSDHGFIDVNVGTLSYTRFINHKIASAGSVVENNSGIIEHCCFDLDVNVKSYRDVGGVSINNNGTIRYCSVVGDLYVEGPQYKYCWIYVGGVCVTGSVEKCYSNLKIEVYSSYITEYVYAGGITSSGYVTDCRSETEFSFFVPFLDYNIVSSAGSATNKSTTSYGIWLTYNSEDYTNGMQYIESNFPKLDFTDTWVITADGPMPQGVMNEDGKCLYKEAYTAPTCSEDGEVMYKDQYGNITSENLTSYPHKLVEGACKNDGCDYKEVYKINLEYNGESVASEFEAYKNTTYQFTADITPVDASDKSLVWTSSDETVATVSRSGLVRTAGEGACKITATSANNVSKSINIKVIDAPSGTKTTVSELGKAFTVKPINIDIGNTVILALYNGDEFVEIKTAVYNGEDIPFETDKAYTDAKVMVWNGIDKMIPVCGAEKLE